MKEFLVTAPNDWTSHMKNREQCDKRNLPIRSKLFGTLISFACAWTSGVLSICNLDMEWNVESSDVATTLYIHTFTLTCKYMQVVRVHSWSWGLCKKWVTNSSQCLQTRFFEKCNMTYIRERGRKFITRINERERSQKLKNNESLHGKPSKTRNINILTIQNNLHIAGNYKDKWKS